MVIKTIALIVIVSIFIVLIRRWVMASKEDYIDYASYDEQSKILTAVFKSDKVMKYRLRGKVWKKAKDNSNVGLDESDTLDYIKDYIFIHGNPFPKAHLNNKKNDE